MHFVYPEFKIKWRVSDTAKPNRPGQRIVYMRFNPAQNKSFRQFYFCLRKRETLEGSNLVNITWQLFARVGCTPLHGILQARLVRCPQRSAPKSCREWRGGCGTTAPLTQRDGRRSNRSPHIILLFEKGSKSQVGSRVRRLETRAAARWQHCLLRQRRRNIVVNHNEQVSVQFKPVSAAS